MDIELSKKNKKIGITDIIENNILKIKNKNNDYNKRGKEEIK